MIVDTLREEFEIWRQTLPAETTSDFQELDRPVSIGRAVRLTVETPTRAAEVIVWESGEADLVVGDLSAGEIVASEHMEITTRFGIREMLEDITRGNHCLSRMTLHQESCRSRKPCLAE